MESVSLTVGAISTLIFSKAIEKGGEKLGEVVSKKIAQLLNIIHEKFKKEGVEGKLTKAQQEPSQKNKSRFERELVEQMEDDEVFANKLKAQIDELNSDGNVRQIFLKGINVKGDAEIGDVEQTATPGASVSQEAVTGVEIGKNLKIGNLKQKS